MRQALPYAVLAIGIIIMGLIAWWFGSRVTDTSRTPGDSEEIPNLHEGLSIYTNGVYGFLVSYPEGALVEEGYDGNWSTNASTDGSGVPVLSIATYETRSDAHYPRSFVARVRVGVSENAEEVRSCTEPRTNQGETQESDVVLSGHTFKAFSFHDAAMMQYEKGVSYRTVFEGRCYAIEKIVHGSSYREDAPSAEDIPDSVLEAEYQKLDDIVTSFQFAR